MHIGLRFLDDVICLVATSHDPETGGAIDADANPLYRIYEQGETTPVATGSLSKLDDANTTGFYRAEVTLSAANGFEKGKLYVAYVQAAVGGVLGVRAYSFEVLDPAKILAAAYSGEIPPGADPAVPTAAFILQKFWQDARNEISVEAGGTTKMRDSAGVVTSQRVLTDDGTTFTAAKVTAPS